MVRISGIRLLAAGAVVLSLSPAACLAATLGVTSVPPVRPQINLLPSLRMDVRPQGFPDLDLSEACNPDHRLRKGKRRHHCRRDR